MNGSWSTLEIGGRRADIYDRPGISSPRLGILYLHDSTLESLRDRPVFSALFDRFHMACVCPEGQQSWWTDRTCKEFGNQQTPERHLLHHALPFFEERWKLPPRNIGLLGIGMGGQGALRVAFKHPEMFPAVAAIAPALDYHELYGQGTPLDDMYDSKEQCRQDTALMHVHPSHYPPHIFFCIDPDDVRWYRGNDRLHEKLNALGIPHQVDLETRAGGHAWPYYNHMAQRAVAFLHHGLEQESRRLL
jgi:S-formylglutathione hydrolase FrmB